MAVNVGNVITAAQYNSLQNRVATVVGNGVNNYGYGQPISSTQVSTTGLITAQRMIDIRNDMSIAYTHQTGLPFFPLDDIDTGDIIAADTSEGNVTKGFNDYLTLMTTLETNRFDVASEFVKPSPNPSAEAQQDVTPAIASDARTTQWSYVTITSEVVITFTTTNARRHFFNSGGEIRISGIVENLAGSSLSYQRNLGWQEMIENPGTIVFNHNSIRNTNTNATGYTFPQTQDFGNYQLTPQFQEVFRKNASGGVYSNSYWALDARQDSNSVIRFRIRLYDDGPESDPDAGDPGSIEGGVEEPVTADITMRYGAATADGAVTIPYPAFAVVNNFE